MPYLNFDGYDERRMEALERAAAGQGVSVEQLMLQTLAHLYQDLVPDQERAKIEAEIASGTAEQERADQSLSVIRLREANDNFLFTTHLYGLYDAAMAYHNGMQQDVGRLTLDSLALAFEDIQPIDEITYSILADAMANDDRVSAILEFDFDDGTIAVKEQGNGAWRAYNLEDVSEAVGYAEGNPRLSAEAARQMFSDALCLRSAEMRHSGISGLDQMGP